ncbi:MAG: hypothetical protein ACLGSH_13845 [Acidobacteriota bacterium]
MAKKPPSKRILGISLRSQRLGFAIIEGSVDLIHWGMVYYEKNEDARIAAAARRVAALLERFTPSALAIEKSRTEKALNPERVELLYRSIRREASKLSASTLLFTRSKVREAFQDFGIRSKDEIAALLARMFPELQPSLPPKRKLWEPEHFSMPMFDAVALAVACWRRKFFQE